MFQENTPTRLQIMGEIICYLYLLSEQNMGEAAFSYYAAHL